MANGAVLGERRIYVPAVMETHMAKLNLVFPEAGRIRLVSETKFVRGFHYDGHIIRKIGTWKRAESPIGWDLLATRRVTFSRGRIISLNR